MVAHAKKTTKNTGILNLAKIRSAPSKNPIDKWKNEAKCYLCNCFLKKSNNRLEYVYLIDGSKCYKRLNLDFSNNLGLDTKVEQICFACRNNKIK